MKVLIAAAVAIVASTAFGQTVREFSDAGFFDADGVFHKIEPAPLKAGDVITAHGAGGVAGLASVVHEVPFQMGSGIPFTLSLPQHDADAGMLLQVEVSLSSVAFGEGYADSELPFACGPGSCSDPINDGCAEWWLKGVTEQSPCQSGNVAFAQFVAPAIGQLIPPITYNTATEACSFGPDDEPGDSDFMGPDSCMVLVETGPSSGSSLATSGLGPYIGDGVVEIEVAGSNSWCLAFCNTGSLGVQSSQIAGLLAVTYTYDPTSSLCQSPDCDGSGTVDAGDLVAIIETWGPVEMGGPTDIDCNADCGVSDLLAVIAYWGQ